MQTSITKLEQAADQLHLTLHSTTTNGSSFDAIKREIQTLKELFLGRSQFPSIPPKIPSWQLEAAEVYLRKIYSLILSIFFIETESSFITNN
jgi:hypothetical protein